MSKENDYKLAIDLLELLLKPGYLYCKGRDGHIYCIEADIPEPGQVLKLPPAIMPGKTEDTDASDA